MRYDSPMILALVGAALLGAAAVAYGHSLLVVPLVLFGGLLLCAALVSALVHRRKPRD